MSARLIDSELLTSEAFLAFLEERPDEERWELLDGVPVMMTSPRLGHQLITTNLLRLINEALDARGSSLDALPQGMVDLRAAAAANMYVPDVLVLDADTIEMTQNVTQDCRLSAEIVSPSDRRRIGRGLGRKIEVKTQRYRSLPLCEAVLVVEQDRYEAVLHLRDSAGWTEQRLDGPAAELAIPMVGLSCRLGELYARTPLARGLV